MSDFLESLAEIGRAAVGAPSPVSGGSTEDAQKTVSNLQAYRESLDQEAALRGEENSKLAEYIQSGANSRPDMISQRSNTRAVTDSLLGIGTGIAQPLAGSVKGIISPEGVLAIDGFFEGARDWQSPQAKAQVDDWRQKQNVFTEALEQAVAENKIDSVDAQIAIAKNSFKDLPGTMIQHLASEGAGNIIMLAGATAVGAGPAAWTAMGVSSASEPASAIAESLYGRDAKGEFKLTHEDLMESPKYREYMEKYNDPSRARRLLYGDSKNMGILSLENLSATAVGLFGDKVLLKSAGLLKSARVTKGLTGVTGSTGTEILSENIENIGHTVSTNKAAQKYYDPDRDTLAGVGADISASTIGALGGVGTAYTAGVGKAVGGALFGSSEDSSNNADGGDQSTPRQNFQNLMTPKATPPDAPSDDSGGGPTPPNTPPPVKPDSPLKPVIDSLKWEDLTEDQEPNESIRGVLNGSTDKVDAAYRAGEAIKSGDLSPEDSLSLFNDVVRPVFGALHQITQASQEAMSKLEDGDESLATLQQWGEVSKAVGSDVELQDAVAAAMEAATKVNVDLDTSKRGSEQLDTVRNIENVVDVNADVLTEQQIDDALALKEFDPSSEAESKPAPFKPATIKKLQTLKSIFEAQKVAQSKSGNTKIGNEITLGEGSGAKGLSTKGHAVAILDMLEAGNKEGAKEQLAVLGRFLQSQENKAAALIAGRDSGEREQTYQTTGANYVSPAQASITYMPEGAGAKLLRTVQAEVAFIQTVVDDLTATVEGKKQTKSTPTEAIVEATANPSKSTQGDITTWSDDELDYQRDRLRSYKNPRPIQVENLAKVEAEVLRREKEEAATQDVNLARSRAQENARISQEIEGDNRLPEPDRAGSTLSQDFKNKVNARVDKLSPSELDNLISKLEGNKNPDNREMYLLDSLKGRREELNNEEAQIDDWISSMFGDEDTSSEAGVESNTPTTESVGAPTQQESETPTVSTTQSQQPPSSTPTFDGLPVKDPETITMTYAGIGSRETPQAVLDQMTAYAERLEGMGYTLRSGGAKGADSAFENGTQTKQIFYANDATDQTRQIAKEIHPRPDALKGYGLNLMARNTNQLFGKNLDTPVDFVLAWTPDGAETTADRTIKTGGTGQAIDMASRKGIPVFNLATADGQARFEAYLESLNTEDAPVTPSVTEEEFSFDSVQESAEQPTTPKADFKLNDGQQKAYDAVVSFLGSAKDTFSIIGSAGTGKTTIVNEILKNPVTKKFSRVVLTSPTHRANAVTLSNNPGKNVLTLHKLLGLSPAVDIENFDAKTVKFDLKDTEGAKMQNGDLIIIDESSMINDSLYDVLVNLAQSMPDTKIIFLGDSAQLGPVNQANKSKALTSTTGSVELTEVMRAKNAELLDESIGVRNKGTFSNKSNMNNGSGVQFIGNSANFLKRAIDLFKSDSFKDNPLLGRVVAFTNARVVDYNRRIRQELFPDNLDFAKGDLLMGYAAFGKPSTTTGLTDIANGMDYVVKSVGKVRNTTVLINNQQVSVPVIQLTIVDVLGINGTKTIDVVPPSMSEADREALANKLGGLINAARTDRSLWKQYYGFKEQIVIPFDLTYENRGRKLNAVARTIDYGYAHTIHKSQGGTYNYVLVDNVDINKARDPATQQQLRYVGLTRAQHGSFVLTNDPITNASPTKAPTPATQADTIVESENTINIWHGTGENAELSNLAERPFHYKGVDYFSVEHAYQSLKSGAFDRTTYDKYKAGNQKIAGRKGTKTDGDWNLKLMRALVQESFKQNPDAKKALLDTGDAKFSHTQDKGVWKTEFPRILESVRKRLNETPAASTTQSQQTQGLENNAPKKSSPSFVAPIEAAVESVKKVAPLVEELDSVEQSIENTADEATLIELEEKQEDLLDAISEKVDEIIDQLIDQLDDMPSLVADGIRNELHDLRESEEYSDKRLRDLSNILRTARNISNSTEDMFGNDTQSVTTTDTTSKDKAKESLGNTAWFKSFKVADKATEFWNKTKVVSAVIKALGEKAGESGKGHRALAKRLRAKSKAVVEALGSSRDKSSVLGQLSKAILATNINVTGPIGQEIVSAFAKKHGIDQADVDKAFDVKSHPELPKDQNRVPSATATAAMLKLLEGKVPNPEAAVNELKRDLASLRPHYRMIDLMEYDPATNTLTVPPSIVAAVVLGMQEYINDFSNNAYSHPPDVNDLENFHRAFGFDPEYVDNLEYIQITWSNGATVMEHIPTLMSTGFVTHSTARGDITESVLRLMGVRQAGKAREGEFYHPMDNLVGTLMDRTTEENADMDVALVHTAASDNNFNAVKAPAWVYPIFSEKGSDADVARIAQSAISEELKTDKVQVKYFGTTPPQKTTNKAGHTLSESQQKAKDYQESIPFVSNRGFLNTVLHVLGEFGIIDAFGFPEANDGDSLLNRYDRTSKNGKNLSLLNALKELQNLELTLEDNPETEVFYPADISSVNRSMMLGGNNPQANKVIRGAMSPNRTTIDASKFMRNVLFGSTSYDDLPSTDKFLVLAYAQAFGISIHNNTHQQNMEKLKSLVNSDGFYENASDWFNASTGDKSVDTSYAIAESKRLLKNDWSELALQTMIELGGLLNSTEEGTSDKFVTHAYIEADGITNGPFMAAMMLGVAPMDPQWITFVQNAGLIFGKDGNSNEFRSSQLNTPDNYSDVASDSKSHLRESLDKALGFAQRIGTAAVNQFKRHDATATTFMSSVFNHVSIDKSGNVSYTRNTAKNPVTVTFYGSGTKGIAAKFTKEAVDVINELQSAILKTAIISDDGKRATIDWRAAATMFYDGTPDAFLDDEAGAQAKVDKLYATIEAIAVMTSSKKVAFENSKENKVYAFISNKAKTEGPKVPPFILVQENDVINLDGLTNNTLSRDQLAILTANLTEYMAEPLTKSLESKATSTLDATKVIKDATNAYSIAVKKILDAFLLEAKKSIYSESNPDGYHPVYGYSSKTLKELKDRMIRMGLTAEIAGKLFSLMVTERTGATAFTGNHGVASLNAAGNPSGLSANSRQEGFGLLGVAGIPRFVQASGDAATITNFLNEALLAGMGKFMQIYDGINLSADNWEQGSKMANDAVMQAIQDRPLNGLIKQMKKIERYGDVWNHAAFDEIKDLQKKVNAGLDILEKHAFSIDHLAATGNNSYHEGKTFDTSDPVEIASIMSGREPAPTVVQGVQEVTIAYPESEHRTEFSEEERQSLLVHAALAFKGNDLAYNMFRAVVKAAKDKGVSFMKAAKPSYLRRSNTVNLRDNKPETLAHELSHAAITSTVDIIGGSRKGRVTQGSRRAYKNLVTLFDEVMISGEHEVYPVIQQAMKHALQAEQNALKNGSTAKQAEADKINEFVVSFINSPDVVAITENMKPQSTLIQLTQAVWKFISEVLGMENVSDDNLHNVLVQQWAALSEGTIEVSDYAPSNIPPGLNSFEFSNSDSDTAAKTKIKEVYEKALGLTGIQETVSRGKNIAAAIESSDALANTGLLANQQEEDAFYNANLMFRISQDVDPSGQTGLRKIANHVIKNLKPEHFGNTDIADSPAYYTAHNKYNDVLGTLNSDRGSLVPNLIALSYASAEMRSVLNELGMPKATEGYDRNSTFEQYLGKLGYTAIAKVSDLLDKTNGVPSEAVKELVEGLGKKPQGRAVSELLTLPGIAMDKANAFVSDGLSALAKQVSKAGENVGKSNSKSGKALGATIQTIAGIVDKETSTQAAETVTALLNSTNGTNVFKDVFRDIIGRIPSNARIYDLTKLVRSAVQRMRTMYVDGTPANIQRRFKTLPTPEQWKALTKSLADTDIAAVSLIHGVSRTIELLSNKNKLSSRISELESKLSEGHIRKSKQLAKFLTTRQTGSNLLKNATDIGRMFGEPEQHFEVSKETVQTIDEYVSLLAYSSMDNKVVEGMFKSEPDALDFMMSIQVGIAKEEQRKGVGAATQGWKGYIPKPLSGSIKIFSDAEGKRMEARGYVRVGDYVGSKLDLDRTKRGYYVSTVNQNRPFAQGIIQNAIRSNNGIDSATGRSSVNFTDKQMNLDPTEAMLLKARIRRDDTKYGIVPLYSDGGVLYGYERMMDPSMMESISQNENLSEMLGVQRGRQMEEAIASTVNRSVVDELEANYVEVNDSKQFIDILDPSTYADDKVLQDAVGILSQEAKDYAKSTYGRMMVKKEMLTNVVGYRQLGFASFFDGTTNLDSKTNQAIVKALEATVGKNAYKHLVRGEDAWRGFVADAKQLIVVKSVVVPAINALSNIIHLVARGVPLASLAKIPAKIIEIEQYVSNTKRMIEIESELLAASNSPYKIVKLKAERDSLQESNSRMTIAPLIQSGEFTSIVSASVDQESSELHNGKVAEYIEGGLNRLSGPAQTVARNVIISRDTAIYQFLQKSVDYGDFVAKAIMYDDIVTRQGKSKESALGTIKEEFINYDYLPGRLRGSLEGLGILWFYNFKIRSLKIGLSMIRENPLHAIAAMHGVPTQTPMGELEIALDSNVVYKLMDGSLPYSVGPSMGLESYRLHPLYNLMN